MKNESLSVYIAMAKAVFEDRGECLRCPLYSPDSVCVYMENLLEKLQILTMLVNMPEEMLGTSKPESSVSLWEEFAKVIILMQPGRWVANKIDQEIVRVYGQVENIWKNRPNELGDYADVLMNCPTRRAAELILRGLDASFIPKRKGAIDSLIFELSEERMGEIAELRQRFDTGNSDRDRV